MQQFRVGLSGLSTQNASSWFFTYSSRTQADLDLPPDDYDGNDDYERGVERDCERDAQLGEEGGQGGHGGQTGEGGAEISEMQVG